jgi:primary-amine oxidase
MVYDNDHMAPGAAVGTIANTPLSDHEHPLDMLSADEVERAVGILKEAKSLGDDHRFVAVYLQEPPKDLMRNYKRGDEIEREAYLVVLDRGTGKTFEAVVSLSSGTVTSWTHVAEVQPAIMLDEFEEVEVGAKQSAEFGEALAKRGITDLDLVCVEPWSAGYYGDDDQGRRLMRALVYVKKSADDVNPYAHPVDNLVVIFDLNHGEVVRIEDTGVVQVPQAAGHYRPDAVGSMRTSVKPLDISQPDGPSFQLQGHQVTWEKWSFHVGFTPREGVVLNQVAFRDGDELRPVLYRASLSEMVVPYGDPSSVQYRKNAFDAGEYNIGALANSLELGCDCLGEIRYFDVVMNDSRGNPVTLQNAICLHEEDAGLLWKHTDFRTGHVEVRRSRRLVISFIATVANYEYAFYWNLYQDGNIEFLVKATGIVSTGALPRGEKSRYGQILNNEGLYAPIHQHIFNIRLDMDVDGNANSVYEVNTEVPEDNPTGSAFYPVETLLRTEQEAIRLADSTTQRYWKIVNHSRRNAVGDPTAYRLHPSDAVTLFARPHSSVAQRAAFAQKTLWVTPYSQEERHAAGEYPNQSRGGSGLPTWTAADRDIVDEDIVVWYTFGAHHVVRPEDWPVMPVQVFGFMLQPYGFFDENPTLDVPVNANGHCHGSDDNSPEDRMS